MSSDTKSFALYANTNSQLRSVILDELLGRDGVDLIYATPWREDEPPSGSADVQVQNVSRWQLQVRTSSILSTKLPYAKRLLNRLRHHTTIPWSPAAEPLQLYWLSEHTKV